MQSYKALCKRGRILICEVGIIVIILVFQKKKKDKEKYLNTYVMVKTTADLRNGTIYLF